MARIAFEKIMAGMDDALAYADGDSSRGTTHQVKVADVDITQLREKLGLSQDRFAALFGLSARTVRNWEQGVRQPEGPARILLQVIDQEPEAVMRALHAGVRGVFTADKAQAATQVAEDGAIYLVKRSRGAKG